VRRVFILIASLAVAVSAHAQFKLPDLNVNRLLDTAKSLGKAVHEPWTLPAPPRGYPAPLRL